MNIFEQADKIRKRIEAEIEAAEILKDKELKEMANEVIKSLNINYPELLDSIMESGMDWDLDIDEEYEVVLFITMPDKERRLNIRLVKVGPASWQTAYFHVLDDIVLKIANFFSE